jgi:hypothetical protein
MTGTEKADKLIRQYLLGELSEPEQAALETEFFGSGHRFEEICAVENDLIDDYVHGVLPVSEREQFEARYCSSPEKLRRVQFAGTMHSSLNGVGASARSKAGQTERARTGLIANLGGMLARARLGAAPALASLALILAAAVVLLGLESVRLRQRLTATEHRAAYESLRNQELERELDGQRATSSQLTRELDELRNLQNGQEQQSPPSAPLSPIVAAFTLRAGLVRGSGEAQVLVVPPTADVIELRLEVSKADFRRYSATLTTPEGTVVARQTQIRAHVSGNGTRIAVRVAARLLAPGDYILRVDGVNAAGETGEASESYFRVAR